VQEKLTDIKISPEFLQSYIDARENTQENTQAIIRGMYSAALLEIICTTQPNTGISINGKGKTFNFLFYHIKHARYLVLQNVKGESILKNAGFPDGSIQHITLNDITGNWTLFAAGSQDGNMEYITLNNIKGANQLNAIGSSNGHARYITIKNTKDEHLLTLAGWYNGNAEYVLEEEQLTKRQKRLISQIDKITESIHGLLPDEQQSAHEKIAELQKEIFRKKWQKPFISLFETTKKLFQHKNKRGET